MRRQDLQAYEAGVYIAERIPNLGITRAIGVAAPTDGVAGYAIGCMWQNASATFAALTAWYINVGTFASATWKPISLAEVVASSRVVNVTASPLTVTAAAHGDRIITINLATGVAASLPAFTGSGYKYKFVYMTATSGGSQTIVATGAYLFGGVLMNTDTAAGNLFTCNVATNAGGSTTITLDGSTKGGRKGDWIQIEDVGTNQGLVTGMLNGSGTEDTPFS